MPTCLCCALGTFEALAAWQSRVAPVLGRMARRGRPIDSMRLRKVARLVAGFEVDDPSSTALTNNHHSHHMLWCPARVGGARIAMPPLHKAASVARK